MNNEQQLFLENEKLIHFVLKDIHTNKIEYEGLGKHRANRFMESLH